MNSELSFSSALIF